MIKLRSSIIYDDEGKTFLSFRREMNSDVTQIAVIGGSNLQLARRIRQLCYLLEIAGMHILVFIRNALIQNEPLLSQNYL